MKFCITVNDRIMKNSDGDMYEFNNPMDAINMIDICYGLSSLKNGVAIGMLAGTQVYFDSELSPSKKQLITKNEDNK